MALRIEEFFLGIKVFKPVNGVLIEKILIKNYKKYTLYT